LSPGDAVEVAGADTLAVPRTEHATRLRFVDAFWPYSRHLFRGDQIMPSAHVDAVVRLKVDVPTLGLQSGDRGVVVSVWLSPLGFSCEVEFPKFGGSRPVRTLLRAEQLEVVQ
jgi:hypothetical protein